MTSARRVIAIAVTIAMAFVAVVATWPTATSAATGSAGDAGEAARLLRGTRAAVAAHDFDGTAAVTWATSKGVQTARVEITGSGGDVTIATDDRSVVDEGRRTYLRDHLGWTGLSVEPTAHDVPAPDRRWALATAGATTVAGRPATVVVAARPDGTPAQRTMVDDASGLLLAREVVGPRGKVERSVRFTSIAVGGPAAPVATPPHDVRTPDAEHLRSVPDGYHAPRTAAGFELVTRSRHPDGVLLFYSDGVFTVSVFEQRGDLDWDALPAGGARSSLADTRTRTYREPGVDVAVWERDGTVYTCVTDAPSDVFDRLVASFAPADRSAGEKVVDFVLGPFGWR